MSIPKLNDYLLPAVQELPVNKVNWAFDSKRAALLIHDMQNYFLNFWQPDSQLVTQVIDNIARLKIQCQKLGIPVFYTAQPDHQSDADRGLLNDMWGAGLNKHPEQQSITDALTPESDDTLLVKWRYSAFQRSDLEQLLKNSERDQLIICGIYAHIGCMTTATDAFMRDIKPFFVADALADFSREEHMMSLRYVAGRSGRVLTTATLLNEMSLSSLGEKKWDREHLRAEILPLLDDDCGDIDDHENLLDYGLDSVRIMSLITRWNNQGHQLDFITLVKTPTLSNWLTLLTDKREVK
ncbi:2,3-dihydro-2,3-dihydroxybenzoate synthetase (isochorismatase) (N-terminal); aryl carrier protein (C-terminal) (enterobactin synthase multienzyme complex component) [Xenorhabdus bovienii str. Jollieti]|uniref:isochorismatase n=1 Tax=Xenorhabdus bovienii (strain SS-2004) TaxID=406818 RepID=D3V0J4_XENBS|nr:isochorismatase [Xenorhabdus bovienii]CBJ80568.1 2,3-dihydro-2,3-dihydroxybenzoate synthetase (isochorismatase) (N-terminal); aryl carrier protein (C-terminal) (enterobactin synthase multienzyme complex component) [Xenorhabdus bovienii SS-2004]CDH29450.1 2,3-dihydro-2,3-dihydroxybenzoate synthetase (isochorismatase) (N-terminal); aryl carrier protein (C-terminal) (enterobactin synthase multienzyme complex component) [Xenorhabdus bovienii str. Jollieti]